MDQIVQQDIRRRLIGMKLPDVRLPSTAGGKVDFGGLLAARTVIYCYPRTSQPGMPAPKDWDIIPGARGCTPQACAFRDHHYELQSLRTDVFGLSTQSTAFQREVVERLHLPFEVLSDEAFQLTDALRLPTFEADGVRVLKRLTMIIRGNVIENVLYPVRHPERSAAETIAWLEANPL